MSRLPVVPAFMLVLFLLIVLPFSSGAETQRPGSAETADSPALGLALAGGGALGFAHLGVILVLEEVGLDPQYLAGTSIGSIVGALYAAGYTGEQMLQVVEEADWNSLLFDQPHRTSLNVSAREATRRYRASVRFDGWQLVTPTGFSAGQRATEYLDSLLRDWAGIDSFSELPRPIGIVATDLVTGEEVVFTDGDLKSAVRASMAVPGVFTPLHYQGRYLIDGGWTNNMPVDVVRELGADVVIAVNLFNPDRTIDELQDIGTIVEQAGIILRQERIDANMAQADLSIVPDLRGYTTVDFDRAMELVERGREAALAVRDDLEELRDRLAEAGSPAVRSGSPESASSEGYAPSGEPRRYNIGAVHLEVPEDRDVPESLRGLRRFFMGKTLTAREISDGVTALYDSGEYEYISYDLTAGVFSRDDDEYYTMTLYGVPQKPYRSEMQLGFGSRLHLDGELNTRSVLHGNYVSSLGGDVFQFETDLWVTEVAQTRAAVSARIAGPVRLGLAGYLLAPPLITYDERTVESLYLQRRNGLELWLETPLLRRATLGVSGFTEWLTLDRVQGREYIDEFSTRRVGVSGRLHYDTLDRPFFPTTGGEASFSYRGRFDNEDQTFNSRFDYSGRRFFRIGDRVNLQLRLEGGSDLNTDLPAYERYYTGGAELFEGYYYHELSGNHILTVGGDLRFDLFRLPLGIGESVYLRIGGNAGRIWDETFDAVVSTSTVAGGRIGVAIHTNLGELNIGYSMNDSYRSLVYVLLGPAYTFGGNGYQW
jgi:NTE family protein